MTTGAVVAPDQLWLNFPLVGHAIVTIDETGIVTSYNEGARLLFAIAEDDGPVDAGDLFGPPVGQSDGVRTLLDGFADAPDQPPAWSGNLVCFRGPGRPFVVTATATRDLNSTDGRGRLTLICGPPPHRNAAIPAASWLPPDLSRRIGHELRGSLTGIAGLAAIMLRRGGTTGGGTTEELRRLGMIEQNARAGIAVVDRVVELSQLESGRTRCRKVAVDVSQIAAASIGMCAAMAGPGRRLIADTPSGTIVRTDPDLVRPILAELILNALIAGAAQQVRVQASERTGSVRIDVTDDGCGIALDEQETIFDPFVRGEAAADGAAGLGLHLARRRAHMIGAELTVLSTPGHGSTFTLTLPAEARGSGA